MLSLIATDYEDEEDPDAKRWKEEHRRFLEENRPDVLRDLQKSGSLDSYLPSVGNSASEMPEHEMARLLNDKEHQKLPFQERVRQLQNRRQETEEVIRHDPILQPIAD